MKPSSRDYHGKTIPFCVNLNCIQGKRAVCPQSGHEPLILKIYTLEKGGSNGTSQVSWRSHGRISQRPVGGLFHRTRGRTEPNSIWRRCSASEPFRDITGRCGSKLGTQAPVCHVASHSAGARL